MELNTMKSEQMCYKMNLMVQIALLDEGRRTPW